MMDTLHRYGAMVGSSDVQPRCNHVQSSAGEHGTTLAQGRLNTNKELRMNWNIIEGKWDVFSGKVRSRWAKLTDDDISNIAAKRDVLIGKIQERYGVLKDDAEAQVDEWLKTAGTAVKKL